MNDLADLRTSPRSGDKLQPALHSPTSSTDPSDSSSCMTSPCFGCIFAGVQQPDGRNSSIGSSDLDELGDAAVHQLPTDHKDQRGMTHLDLSAPSKMELPSGGADVEMLSPLGEQLLRFDGSLSPRQESGKRYYGSYLLHRTPMAAGLLKSWKRRYFRLRDHGLVCYKTQDANDVLFEVNFTTHSMLVQDQPHGDRTSSNTSLSSNSSGPKRQQPSRMNASSSGKHSRTSSPDRTAPGPGSLVLIIKHAEVVGHLIPAKNIEIPVFLKADDESERAAWSDCIRFAIEAYKRKLLQVSTNHDDDTDEMTSPTPSLPGSRTGSGNLRGRRGSDSIVSKTPPRRRSSGSAIAPDLVAELNKLVVVEDFDTFRSKYLLMKEIGEGSFSIVHRAVNRMTGRMCAVKCCKISAALEEEERLLRTLSHPNVVGLEGVYARDKNLHYVVMDYLKNGDLCDLLIERQRLPEPEARRIIRQVVEGLAYLHRQCVLHRDIKPENILIHGNIVKIGDFGLAKQLAQPSTMLKRSCGTLEYAAPELLCGRPYGLKSDVFSLGVVLYVLLFGAFPFSVESAAALQSVNHVSTGVDVRDMSCLSRSNMQWRTVSPLAQDALLKMLKTDDIERISAEDLLGHPWFDEVDSMSDSATSTPEDFELARIDDCETMGFAELLSRGFQVVKYGYKESTTPHSTTLTLDFMEECITWTGRKNAMLMRVTSLGSDTGSSEATKRGRSIKLREIQEIREGHATDCFLSCARSESTSKPPPELCLSIVCSWRTLDIVVEAPSQREFMVRGLRRLLPASLQIQ